VKRGGPKPAVFHVDPQRFVVLGSIGLVKKLRCELLSNGECLRRDGTFPRIVQVSNAAEEQGFSLN
jgi:hypothetical protein